MSDLRITTVQTDLVWENPRANYDLIAGHLKTIDNPTDLIVLPEMFTTGFSMRPEETAEKFHVDMNTILWMRERAREHHAAIVGSVSVEEEGKYYNRMIWVEPNGPVQWVDKRHRFSMGHEDRSFGAGSRKLIVNYKGWNILPLVCYDLRFPVWCRNRLVEGKPEYDLALFAANWPETRVIHWTKLLMARAIENQSYVAGVNRVGLDANDIPHSGGTAVIDPMGEVIQSHPDNTQSVKTTLLEAEFLQKVRRYLSFLKDGDQFHIDL